MSGFTKFLGAVFLVPVMLFGALPVMLAVVVWSYQVLGYAVSR